jgi:hypothetical protein
LNEDYSFPLVGLFEPLYKLVADKELIVRVKNSESDVQGDPKLCKGTVAYGGFKAWVRTLNSFLHLPCNL